MTAGRVLKWIWAVGLPWAGLLGFASCNQPVEACLDILARNYDVEADRPCGGCCEYPNFRIDLQHKVVQADTALNLLLDSLAYRDAAGNRFGVLSAKSYLSNFRLIRDNGGRVASTDTLGLRYVQAPGDTVFAIVEDNFALADPSNFGQRDMGSFRAQGQMERVGFLLGLRDTADRSDPAYLPQDHPLADEEMLVDGDIGHSFSRLEVFTLNTTGDTLRTVLEIGGQGALREVDFPASFFLDPGFSPRVVFQIDYAQWFGVLDLTGKTPEEMERDLLEAIASSYTLVSVGTVLN